MSFNNTNGSEEPTPIEGESFTLTPAAVQGHNLQTIRCDNPRDIRPALTACTQEIDKMVQSLADGQKAVFNFGELHSYISHIFTETAFIADLHKKYSDRLMVVHETPHNYIEPNQHPATTFNSFSIARLAPYSKTYLLNYLYSNNIATYFCDLAKKEGKIDLSDSKNRKFIKDHGHLLNRRAPIWLQKFISNNIPYEPPAVFIRNAFMTYMAFEQARENQHDILVFLTGSAHVFGINQRGKDYPYIQSLSHIQQNSIFTQETITPKISSALAFPQPQEIDGILLSYAKKFNDTVLVLDNLDTSEAFLDLDFVFSLATNIASPEQEALHEIWKASGEEQALGIPEPQLFSEYKERAQQSLTATP